MLGHLPEQELEPAAAQALALLALVAGQDVEPAEDSDGTDGRWRIARQVAPDRVISTVDPDARHAHKTRSRRQDGYKAHIVVEPDTGHDHRTALTPAAGPEHSDATVGIDAARRGTTPARAVFEVLARLGLRHRGRARRTGRAGHTAIIKPWPLRPAVEGGFTLDDFTVDETGRPESTCPNGVTRPITPTRSGDLRRRLPRLPAARPMHHLGDRSER